LTRNELVCGRRLLLLLLRCCFVDKRGYDIYMISVYGQPKRPPGGAGGTGMGRRRKEAVAFTFVLSFPLLLLYTTTTAAAARWDVVALFVLRTKTLHYYHSIIMGIGI